MKKVLYLVLLALLANLILSGSFIYYINTRMNVSSPPEKLDGIIVLFGNFSPDFKAPGNESIRRLNHAAEIHRRYNNAPILCVGGSRPDHMAKGAELMKEYLIDLGIAENLVFANADSYDTYTNWRDAKNVIKADNWQAVGVVSSAMHLYRFNKYIVKKNNNLTVFLLPHAVFQSVPLTSPIELWKTVQYEWASYAAYLLPGALYAKLLNYLRPQ